MTIDIISWSISTKVWDRARIKLVTPGSAVRHVSVARHVTDCATQPAELGSISNNRSSNFRGFTVPVDLVIHLNVSQK